MWWRLRTASHAHSLLEVTAEFVDDGLRRPLLVGEPLQLGQPHPGHVVVGHGHVPIHLLGGAVVDQSSRRTSVGSVSPCSSRVATMTQKVMNRTRSRSGMSVGRAKAAASDTTSRMPAQLRTVCDRHDGAVAPARIRGPSSGNRYAVGKM